VTEFSPFAPVDPQLRSGGGVGGTVTEFTRTPMMLLLDQVTPIEPCPVITAAPGTVVPAGCRPFVRITTRLGTMLADVPVTWEVKLGGGKVAPFANGECVGFMPLVVGHTDPFGRSSVCWKLGVEGTNRLR